MRAAKWRQAGNQIELCPLLADSVQKVRVSTRPNFLSFLDTNLFTESRRALNAVSAHELVTLGQHVTAPVHGAFGLRLSTLIARPSS